MIYLASPYSHPDEQTRIQRFDAACWYVADRISAGELIFSPIVHSHPLVRFGMAGDRDTWRLWNNAIQDRCSETRVLQLLGWDESVGVREEIERARNDLVFISWENIDIANAIAVGKFHRNGLMQINRLQRLLDKEHTID